MGRHRRGKRNHRQQGFSGPKQRPVNNMLARAVGVRGRDKRHFFNQLAGSMVIGAGVAGAFLGYNWFGFFGAVFGLVVGVGAMSKFVVGRRYFR